MFYTVFHSCAENFDSLLFGVGGNGFDKAIGDLAMEPAQNAVRVTFDCGAEFGIIALLQGIRRVGELAALLIEEDAATLPSLARRALGALLAQLLALGKRRHRLITAATAYLAASSSSRAILVE
jgi:hypothetical protein